MATCLDAFSSQTNAAKGTTGFLALWIVLLACFFFVLLGFFPLYSQLNCTVVHSKYYQPKIIHDINLTDIVQRDQLELS